MGMLPLSVLFGASGGATTYDTANTGAVTSMFTNSHAVGIIQDKGFLMTRGSVNTQLAADDTIVSRKVQLQMGCLGDNYQIKFTTEVDELKRRCGTGSRALNKGGAWKFSAEDVEINPLMLAMMTGLTAFVPSKHSGGMLIEVTESLVVTSDALPALANDADWIDSVKVVSSGAGLHEVFTLADNTEFKYTASSKVISFFASAYADGAIIEVTYLYRDSTDTAGIVLADDGSHFPSQMSAVVSFLAVDDDNNAVGRIIAEIPAMRNTSEIAIGGANQELSKVSQDYVIDGIPVFHWQEFA